MVAIKVKRSRKVYTGRIFNLTRTELVLPGGQNIWRETVVHPGAAVIIPELPGQRIILVKQFRYPAGQYLWELPAGTLEPGEKPLACARREITEETGYRARKVIKLAEFYTCPGFCTEKIHLYLARELVKAQAKMDIDEDITSRIFTVAEITRLIKQHKIIDAKTLVGVQKWLEILNS
jgi:ADP-ribose pyrophosphatase